MIVITGATGKTGSKIAELLIGKKDKIRVIGRSMEKLARFSDMGAETMAGDQSDAQFLTNAFAGADAAYLLIPPKVDSPDVRSYYNTLGDAAITAIHKSRIRKIVFLSSLGADKDQGTGPVLGLHDLERKLELVKNTDIVFLRAGYFMENTLMNIPMIKARHITGNHMAAEAPISLVAAKDISMKAAELLSSRNFIGHVIVELFGQRLSNREMTRIIGARIGMSDLSYVQFSEKDAIAGMVSMGLSSNVAESYVEMAKGINAGKITTVIEDPNKPTAPTKFQEFVEEVFYPAYTIN
jgi:uncharacterized protein YbjT (DUF2867 family)